MAKAEHYSQTEAAVALGLSTAGIGMLLRQPGVPSAIRGGRRVVPWPEFAHWYHAKVRSEGRGWGSKPDDLKEIDKRQRVAELALVEIEAATATGRVITVEHHVAVVTEMAERLRATLINLPSDYQLDLERAGVAPDVAQAVLGRIADEVTGSLREAAEHLGAPPLTLHHGGAP